MIYPNYSSSENFNSLLSPLNNAWLNLNDRFFKYVEVFSVPWWQWLDDFRGRNTADFPIKVSWKLGTRIEFETSQCSITLLYWDAVCHFSCTHRVFKLYSYNFKRSALQLHYIVPNASYVSLCFQPSWFVQQTLWRHRHTPCEILSARLLGLFRRERCAHKIVSLHVNFTR